MRQRLVSEDTEVKYGRNAPKQTEFQRKLASLVGGCHLPLSTCDSHEFRELIELLDPRITVPSRRTLTDKTIPQLVGRLKDHVIQPALDSCESGCLLYDLWMSRKGTDTIGLMWCSIDPDFNVIEQCIGMTEVLSTTGASLASEIKLQLQNVGLQDKPIGIVRDGAPNLRLAARDLEYSLVYPLASSNLTSDRYALFETSCLTHQLSLCCSTAMKCDPTIGHAKGVMSKIVTWTRKSGKGANLLKRAQVASDSPNVKLVAAVSTRFASTLAMFKSMMENKDAIIYLFTRLASHENKLPSDLDWQVVKLVYSICKPIMEALLKTESSGRTCLLSTMLVKIIELYIFYKSDPPNGVGNFIQEITNNDVGIHEEQLEQLVVIKEKLRTSIVGSLQSILQPFREYNERTSHFWLSLLLDPRTKRLGILRRLEVVDQEFEATRLLPQYEHRALFALLKMCYVKSNPKQMEELERDNTNYIDDFPQYRAMSQIEDRVHSIVIDEYRSFRRLPEIDSSHCALHWYHLFSPRFPTLGSLARHIFALLPSQSSVERLFSVAGHIAASRRSKLKIENLENLVLVSSSNRDAVFPGRSLDIDSFLDSEISLLDSCLEEVEQNEE